MSCIDNYSAAFLAGITLLHKESSLAIYNNSIVDLTNDTILLCISPSEHRCNESNAFLRSPSGGLNPIQTFLMSAMVHRYFT